LSPARAVDPAIVASIGTGGTTPDAGASAQGEDRPPDGAAVAVPPVLPPPQALPQAILIPTALPASSIDPGADLSERVAVTPTGPAFSRGPVHSFEPASDEPVRKGAAVDLVPAAPVPPAMIAAEPIQAAVSEVAGSPATAPAEVAVSTAREPDRVGLVPAERPIREPNAPAPADPTRAGVRIDAPDFADEFGNRVVWMAGRNQHAAEFRIDPPQLGPVEVRLSLSNDQASLVLLSPHANVRDALQATLPRLHDLLAAAGINLGSVHVGARGHSGGQSGDSPAPGRDAFPEAGLPGTIQASGWVVRGRGMVDVYA
jgi:flagellar hook-length control protein FliK